MKNFIQPGETITITAPHDLKSGSPVMLGSIFGVATNDALKDQDLELTLTGVFSLPKVATESWTTGTLLYWNEVANALTSIADNNQLVGVAITRAASPSSTTITRLNATFLPRGLSDASAPDHSILNGASGLKL